MADFYNDLPTVPNSPVSAREQNNSSGPGPLRNLPRGACNARDSTQNRCGCQKYFDETYGRNRNSNGSLWFCMCGHHACFHNQGYLEERASTDHFTQSHNEKTTGGSLASDPFFGYNNKSTQVESQGSRRVVDSDLGLALSQLQNSLADTLPWNRSAQPSQGAISLPPIPPSCLFPSQERIDRENEHAREGTPRSASTYSEKRPFADLRANSFLPVKRIPPSADVARDESIKSTQRSSHNSTTALCRGQEQPDLTSNSKQATGLEDDVDNLSPADVFRSYSSPIRSIRRDVSNLSNLVQAHGERIDCMENVSFSHTDNSEVHGKLQERQEDIQERFDYVEIRQDELDGRIRELEKLRENESIQGSVIRSNGDRDSASGASFTSTEPPLILSLQTQISEVRGELPPTHERPWDVEVVFLPFGSELKGIWSTIEDFPSQLSRSSIVVDEWTQSQVPLKLEQPSNWERVVARNTQGNEDFLFAKACSRYGRVYARLKSRGFVRTIQINGSTFRDVSAAIRSAFGDLPQFFPRNDDTIPNVAYHALQESWIPLRKLHKDSKLRFLDPSELISQTLWNVEFLKSSVIMRAAERPVLFITHPQGYTQHLSSSDWTWPRLRLMPRVYPDSTENDVKEADANEPCWEFDDRFDTTQSAHSSFVSTHSLTIRQPPELSDGLQSLASRSDHFSSAAASPSRTPAASERKSSLRRTASAPLQGTSSSFKRKPGCHPELRPISPLQQKRQRLSRSPSNFAYATPHSNDYVEIRDDEDDASSQNAPSDTSMHESESSYKGASPDDHLDDTVYEGIQDTEEGDSSDAPPSEYASNERPRGYEEGEPPFLMYAEEDDDEEEDEDDGN